MYSNSHPARHLAQTSLSNQQYMPASSYGEFSGDYHHHRVPESGDPLCGPPPPPPAAWNRAYYAAPPEEWSTFVHHGFPGSSPNNAGQASSYETPGELTASHPGFGGGGSCCTSHTRGPGEPSSPNSSKSCEWIRDSGAHQVSGGRTRTKDKYRVVYSDHQRMELEKEFQYSRYITIRKKVELSLELNLSERQVKIWFQNRRAKERKLTRRKQQLSQQASAISPAPEEADSDPPCDDHSGATTPVLAMASVAVKEEPPPAPPPDI